MLECASDGNRSDSSGRSVAIVVRFVASTMVDVKLDVWAQLGVSDDECVLQLCRHDVLSRSEILVLSIEIGIH